MTPAPIHLAGERLLLDPEGAVLWPAQNVLVVADLHFEKGSSAATRGSLLPPWDTHATLDRLAGLLRRHRPATVIALGDSFHDSTASTRLTRLDAERLHGLCAAHHFVWVLGNHDPHPPAGFCGEAHDEFGLGPLIFRHQARGRPPRVGAELCGHHHPKAQVAARGTNVTRPCFVADAHRLMLPALGTYTGGLDVRSPAIGTLFPRGGRAFLLGRDRLFSFTLGQLSEAPHTAV